MLNCSDKVEVPISIPYIHVDVSRVSLINSNKNSVHFSTQEVANSHQCYYLLLIQVVILNIKADK